MCSSLKVKYIHTLEYSPSSKLCGLVLNRDHRSQCTRLKNLLNNLDGDKPTIKGRVFSRSYYL